MTEKKFISSEWWKILTFLLFFCLFASQACLSSEAHVRYTVRKDESLSLIASNHLKPEVNWRDLASYNNIENKDKIHVGVRLKIPVNWLKQNQGGARLISFYGDVQFIDSNGEARLIKAGEYLNHKAKIITGVEGSATIEFPDETRIHVKSNSSIDIVSIRIFGNKFLIESNINQIRGSSEVKVNPTKKENRKFNVITPAAVASVRGTTFNIEVRDQATILETKEGSVIFKNNHGEVQVNGGYSSVATLYQRPSTPVATNKSLIIQNFQKNFNSLPVKINFSENQNFKLWLIEIRKDSEIADLILSEKSSNPNFTINYLKPGKYSVKAWALDQYDVPTKVLNELFAVNYNSKAYVSNIKIDERHSMENLLELNLLPLDSGRKYLIKISDQIDGNNSIWTKITHEDKIILTPKENKLASGYMSIWIID